MLRHSGLSSTTARRQRGELRLTQLTDDNAFVDVEAVLSASSTLPHHQGTSSSTTAGASGSAHGKERSTGHSDSFFDVGDDLSTSAASGATSAATAPAELRVVLSTSLVEQHKTYLRRTDDVKRVVLELLEDDSDNATASTTVDGNGDDDAPAETEADKAVPGEPSGPGKARGRRAGVKRKRVDEASPPPSAAATPGTRPPPPRTVTSTPVPASSLLARWSGRGAPAHPSVVAPTLARSPCASSSPQCLCGSTTTDVLQAARRELMVLEQWKRWMLSAPSESDLHRLTQSTGKAAAEGAQLMPSWENSWLPWPVVAHFTSCPSHHALSAGVVFRLPLGCAQACAAPASTTTLPMDEDDKQEAQVRTWLGLAPALLAEGCDGAHNNHLCAVCLLPAAYRCVRCKTALVCSIECHVVHDATRCLKFIA